MSYTLYREYRPKSWTDVVGQDQVVSILQSAIKNKSFAHAYLFTGSRGVGKTSVARIFATALGCAEHDIHEMDAASNRGIDEIRQLKESVVSLPFSSPYKVYIIDEVHMLTKDAFNALLKTLEEPPSHVVFILATTEKEKLPETIVSRCQLCAFVRPTSKILASVVSRVCKEEKIHIEEGADDIIALSGQGSYRDTLGALQKVVTATHGKKITIELVQDILHLPSTTLVVEYVEGFLSKNTKKILSVMKTLEETGADPILFFERFLSYVRCIAILKLAKTETDLVVSMIGKEGYTIASTFSETYQISPQHVLLLLQDLDTLQKSIQPYMVLEQIGLRGV